MEVVKTHAHTSHSSIALSYTKIVNAWVCPDTHFKIYLESRSPDPKFLRIWPRSQVVRQESAKLLFGGSIPPVASPLPGWRNWQTRWA